jgi:hypothetical protein
MFLDDELLQIGRNTDMTIASANESCSKMVQLCFKNLGKNITPTSSREVIVANFNRVNNTWRKVVTILDNEGLSFVKIDGFKNFVESEPQFKNIFF